MLITRSKEASNLQLALGQVVAAAGITFPFPENPPLSEHEFRFSRDLFLALCAPEVGGSSGLPGHVSHALPDFRQIFDSVKSFQLLKKIADH